MSYTLNHNASHTSVEVTDLFLPSYLPTSTFKMMKRDDTSVTAICLDAPIDRPETVKVLSRPISNIYNITAGKEINRIEQMPLKRGVHMEFSLHQTWSKEDTTDSAAPRYALPIAAKLLLDVPVDDLITEADLQQFIKDFLGTLCSHTSKTGGSIITTVMKGYLGYTA